MDIGISTEDTAWEDASGGRHEPDIGAVARLDEATLAGLVRWADASSLEPTWVAGHGLGGAAANGRASPAFASIDGLLADTVPSLRGALWPEVADAVAATGRGPAAA